MSEKHTPGPWKRDGLCIDNGYGFTVAAVSAERLDPDSETLEGNLDLIAAAPELLEALRALLNDVDDLMSESAGVAGLHLNGDIAPWSELEEGGRFERISSISQARTAIAKATGEQQ